MIHSLYPMYIPKRYGENKIEKCPFCEDSKTLPTVVNSQGFSVCLKHKNSILDVENMKCVCGEYLELLNGKFGPFFKCMECGNINLKKAFEFNIIKDISQDSGKSSYGSASYTPYNKYDNSKHNANSSSAKQSESTKPKERKEIFIRSDDPRYFD